MLVLNLLQERPMHPYEMRVLIREREQDRLVKVHGASIYDTCARLEAAGLVEAGETSREGRRPERTVYRLTEAGLDEVQDWMRELISRPVQEYPVFTAALAFLYGLPKHEVIDLLRRRMADLEASAAGIALKSATAVETYGVPRIFLIETEYMGTMIRAEIEWIRHLVSDLETTDLWPDSSALAAFASEEERRRGGESRPQQSGH